jgi:hypothetical protein
MDYHNDYELLEIIDTLNAIFTLSSGKTKIRLIEGIEKYQ